LRGVVAAVIDGLAPFRERVVEGLAAFGLQQSEKLAAMRLKPLGGALERSCALAGWRRSPSGKSSCGRRHGCRGSRRIGFAHGANRAAVDR
jgi:hypothetical protein